MDEDHDFAIDLRKILGIFLRQWQLILTITAAVLFVAAVYAFTTPNEYKASALVATTKVSSTVSFGTTIDTLSEEQLMTTGSGAYGRLYDPGMRLSSFAAQVKNPEIAQVVLDQFGDRLEETINTPAEVLKMVSGSVFGKSDTIQISVVSNDPVLASDIANLWAEEYVKRINSIYSKGASEQSYTAMVAQSAQAKVDYDKAQTALVNYIGSTKTDELNRQVAEKEAIIKALSDARTTAIQTVVQDMTGSELEVLKQYYQVISANQSMAVLADNEGRQNLVNSYITTLNAARQAVFDESAQNQLKVLTADYEELRRTMDLLNNAKDMRDQVINGGSGAAASNAMALDLLKAQVFASNGGLDPIQVQTSPTNLTSAQMITDLNSLIATLESRQASTENDIKELSDSFLNGSVSEYLDSSLNNSEDVTTILEEKYRELWEPGQLSAISAELDKEKSPLELDALNRTEALLQLEGLEDILGYSVSNTPLDEKIQSLEQQARELKAQAAREEDLGNELTRARDLAWETYTNLATKQAELAVASQTEGTDVVLATTAVVPDEDLESGGVTFVSALIAGLVLAVVSVLLLELLWSYNAIEAKPIQPVTVVLDAVKAFSRRLKIKPTSA